MTHPIPHPASRIPPTVVKLGGAILTDAAAVDAVWRGVSAAGGPTVIVHGGGPQQTAIAERLGHAPRFVAGRRVTSGLDLEIALWALRGEINARLVASGVARGVAAVGISGADGPTVVVQRRPPVEVDGETVDFGHVGDVVRVEPHLIETLAAAGFVAVVSSVSVDDAGALFNVNADTVATELAVGLGAARLLFVAEAGGVFRDLADPESRLEALDEATVSAGVAGGWIAGGMRPKLTAGLAALGRGVADVRIVSPDGLSSPTSGTRLTL